MRRSSFSANRVGAVAWRVLKQISRDRRTFGMMIVMPAIIMLIFGFALGGEVKYVPIVVDDQDNGYTITQSGNVNSTAYFGGNITTALENDDRVKVTQGTFDSGVCGVDNGTCFAAILIPANFSETLFKHGLGNAASQLSNVKVVINSTVGGDRQVSMPLNLSQALTDVGTNDNATITLYLDGTKPANEGSILAALQSALQDSVGGGGVELDKQFAFGNVEYSGLDVSIPSVIAFVLTFLVLLISLIIITRESSSGVLSRLYATPLSALERLLGYSIGLTLLGVLMVCVILGIGIGVFGVVVEGNFALLFFGAVLYALANIFLAVFLSNFAKNELQAVQMAPLIALPSMALSGMLIPVNAFPEGVQIVSQFVPMYYGNRIFEGIMLKGYGIGDLSFEFAVIGGIALLFFALAVMTVKDRIPA
ncbi:MAG: ABC transporter permease [Candidatus Bathyarchaeota archaeon]|nr:ABC transporter permease [Candidatus Bathyarchaeota archaeon]